MSSKSARGTWHDEFFRREELDQVREYIDDNSDKDIYFCPHGFSKPKRKEEFAVLPTLLYADLDEADPRECKIKPTIAIESSPGRFVGLWSIDKTFKKDVNRRLTYYLEADRGGWDLTQVLRVPGTTNYKYKSTPRVRVMWTDGPEYKLRDIEKELPKEEESEDDNDALEVYKKYEKSFAPWIRRELLHGKPSMGKRSEMIWKLTNSLLEAGVSRDDCFTLLKASPWNKFEGRDDQLRREIEKSNAKKLTHTKKEVTDYRFLTRSMDEVEEENIEWIWYPYFAKGELTIIEGDPNVGKSYLTQMACLGIVDGQRLPSVKKLPIAQGKVAYFDIENSAGSVTKKRLSENGLKNYDDFFQEEEPFSIDDEDTFDEVLEAIERLKPLVVVFDTLNTYIGRADVHKSSEAQQAFVKFRDIARRFGCAVVVLRHLTKGANKALYRGQGSISFAGLARVVITVGLMPDDADTRVMAVTKLNIARPPQALTFTITALPDTLKNSDRSKFRWGEFVDITAEDIVGVPDKNDTRDDAKQFLKDLLKDGPLEVARIEKKADSRSVSWRTVQRAADEIGVVKKLRGFGKEKHSVWSLPD